VTALKIKLAISDESYEEVKEFLLSKGIEIDDDADFVLTQTDRYVGHITVRNVKTAEKIHISVDEIILIESYGHTVEVVTGEETYVTSDRLYQLMNELNPDKFIRVSNSVIIAKKKIKQIRPSLSMKFVLTMENDRKIDVTRSYYNSFKEAFNI